MGRGERDPETVRRPVRGHRGAGRPRAGRAVWAKIYPICEFLESHNYASAIKAGLDLIGNGAGPTRPL